MNGKTIAIVSYITIIGWVIALVLNSSEKNSFASFHIRQALGLNLLWMVLSIIPFFGWMIGLALVVMGLLTAIGDRMVPVPFVGVYFQDWFKTL